jgi:hypothetical protein
VASAFLYAPGAALTLAELSAARIDGHVVEVGDAYIPADAVETAELRAQSVAPMVPAGCAITHLTAAWVHGAPSSAPARVSVQRTEPERRRVDQSLRVEYRDSLIDAVDLVRIGGVTLTSPTRTLADLARAADPDSLAAARALIREAIADVDAARHWLWTHSTLPHTRAALQRLGRIRTT